MGCSLGQDFRFMSGNIIKFENRQKVLVKIENAWLTGVIGHRSRVDEITNENLYDVYVDGNDIPFLVKESDIDGDVWD